MSNEKPGGHGERSVGVGVLDMAFWDVDGQDRGASRSINCSPSGFNNGVSRMTLVYVYAAGGYYYPGKDLSLSAG